MIILKSKGRYKDLPKTNGGFGVKKGQSVNGHKSSRERRKGHERK